MDIIYETKLKEPSERIFKISDAFGIGIDENVKQVILKDFTIPTDFTVLYITGMSGSGKSSLLNVMKKEYNFNEVIFDEQTDKPIVDCIGTDLENALYYLNIVGLGEAFLYVKPYKLLSDGQKYRFKIAKLIESNQEVWCIDEFCSFLDRTTASIVSYNLQKVARKLNKKVIVATAHNDLQKYLQADYVVDFGIGEDVKLFKNENEIINPFLKDIIVEEGTIQDYKKLGKYHYKNTEAKFIKKIYKMTYKDMLIGVAVYSMPKQQLIGRNIYFNKKYINERGIPKMKEVNEDFATGARFIIHPMFRGAGLGRELVKQTSDKLDIKYIEIVSAMAKYNKFLDGSGAKFICNNNSEEKQKKYDKISALFAKYGLRYELLTSLEYCKTVLETMPNDELKNGIYGILRPNFFNNRARFKKFGIDFQTKAEFMEITLTPELLNLAKWSDTDYYIIDKTLKN